MNPACRMQRRSHGFQPVLMTLPDLLILAPDDQARLCPFVSIVSLVLHLE